MDGFNYSNIFETKGIEYIAIIAFFLVLIPFWIILNKKPAVKHKINQVLKYLKLDFMKIPQGIFHSRNHTWAFLEKTGIATVGLDQFLLHSTGFVRIENVKNQGETVKKGELLARLIKGQKQLDVFSPISGALLNSNNSLHESPELLNTDPYGDGWICKIKPSRWVEDTKEFYLAEEAINWSKNEMQRFKDFLAAPERGLTDNSMLSVLQDGGELSPDVLSEMPEPVWKDFQHEFMSV